MSIIEPKKIIDKHRVGVVVKDFEIDSIKKSIKDLLTKDTDKFNKSVKLLLDERSWDVQEKILISFYKENIIWGLIMLECQRCIMNSNAYKNRT